MDEDRDYYVSVRDGNRTGYLLGPYPTHADALANVERGKGLANGANSWAVFYTYGTCSLPRGTAVKTVFGQ